MATPNRKTKPIPVALDDVLLSDIDRVARELKQNRSAVIRSATRAGLPLIQAGGSADVADLGLQILVRKEGAADVVQLDGQLSSDVADIAQRQGWPRQKVLIEAIRAGLEAVHARWFAENVNPEDDLANAVAVYTPLSTSAIPLARDLIRLHARIKRFEALFDDLIRGDAGFKRALLERGVTIDDHRPGGLRYTPPSSIPDCPRPKKRGKT